MATLEPLEKFYPMKAINFEKRWEARHPLYRLEAIPSASVDFSGIIGNEQGEMLISISNSTASTYYYKGNLKKAGNVGLQYISDRAKVKTFLDEAKKTGKKLIVLSKTTDKEIGRMTDTELNNHCQKFFRLFSQLFAYYSLSRPDYLVGVDSAIKKHISEFENSKEKREKIFIALTTPSENSRLNLHDLEQLTFVRRLLEHKIFAKTKNIDRLIKKDKIVSEKLEEIMKKYAWISAQEGSEALSRDHYVSKIGEICQSGKEAILGKISEIKNKPKIVKQKKTELIKKYKINQKLADLCESVADLAELRLNIRLWWTEASFFSLPLFQQLNKRAGLSQSKLNGFCYSEYLLKNEVAEVLLSNKKISNSNIRKRVKRSLLLMEQKVIKFFIGEEADKIEKQYIREKDLSEIKEIKGKIANKGFARARAWVISPSIPDQLEKARRMRRGDILVAAMTRPQFIEAISKSSAIITDEGGLTCHAAIVSREFNKPCIIGTQVATKIIKDGDWLEVDANKGIIKILKN